MIELKENMLDVLAFGEERDTRSGKTTSLFDVSFRHDMRDGFPAVTSKKLAWQSVVGELLWFLSGSCFLGDLRMYTYGEDDGERWTIWTDDADRWNRGPDGFGYVGMAYGHQWRLYDDNVDQVRNLIDGLIRNPHGRRHIVNAWNPDTVEHNDACLPPCHINFRCYVHNDGRLDLKWTQRSWDLFLGAPFNIASYGLLLHLICEWTGYEPGTLICDCDDAHIYHSHEKAVREYLKNPRYSLPVLELPEDAKKGLDSCLELTALDFKDSLVGYKHEGKIPAPLEVGNT